MKIALVVAAAALFVIVATVVLFRSIRVDLPAPASIVVLPDDLDAHLESREARFDDLRGGAGKTIVWHDPATKQRTPLALVYLHGFSATRHEAFPLAETVADSLGANLFLTRLRGHGRDGEAMAEATVADWLADVREAMALAARLGERTVLVGLSTGGTLAVWAATRPEWSDQLEALVLISPNLGPRDGRVGLLLWPGGLTLARWLQGPERTWEPQNEEHAAHWTTRYPIEAVATMMRLVTGVQRLDPAAIDTPLLLLHSDRDTVIRVERAVGFFERTASEHRERIVVPGVADDDGHVLAGDVLSPGTTDRVARAIVGFLRGDTARD
jgi:alpha-beta hydrolase superfamily lysophospholipase